jgi:hypothetical protein
MAASQDFTPRDFTPRDFTTEAAEITEQNIRAAFDQALPTLYIVIPAKAGIQGPQDQQPAARPGFRLSTE